MYVKNFKAFWDLTRLDHGIMYGIAVIIGAFIVTYQFSLPLFFGFLAAVFLEAGIFSLNDYFDFRADKINKRLDRPLVRGDADKDAALSISITGILIGNLLSSLISIQAFLLTLVFSIFSILYNTKLKKYPGIGNIFIGITMAVPFVFGGIIAGEITEPLSLLAGIAFIIGVGRELMKDIQDTKGDKATGGKTLPVLVGVKKLIYSVVVCYIIGIALSLIPFFTFFSEKPFYFGILITDAIFVFVIFKILKNQSEKTMALGRKWTLAAIGIALIVFFLSTF